MTKTISDGRYADENVMIGWTYLGAESITMDASSKSATLPTGTNVVEISAETYAVRYTINGTASATSGGYIPAEQTRYILKLENLTSLAFYGVASGVAHVNYYKEY